MSGGRDPWLRGLTRPIWAIWGRANLLTCCRYRGPWFRGLTRPIGAAGDTRHLAAFVGNSRASWRLAVFIFTWPWVAILMWRSHRWTGTKLGKGDYFGLSPLLGTLTASHTV